MEFNQTNRNAGDVHNHGPVKSNTPAGTGGEPDLRGYGGAAVCRNCGNTGKGWDGEPCACRLPPEWQRLVHALRQDKAFYERRAKELTERNVELHELLRDVYNDLRDHAAVRTPTVLRVGKALAPRG